MFAGWCFLQSRSNLWIFGWAEIKFLKGRGPVPALSPSVFCVVITMGECLSLWVCVREGACAQFGVLVGETYKLNCLCWIMSESSYECQEQKRDRSWIIKGSPAISCLSSFAYFTSPPALTKEWLLSKWTILNIHNQPQLWLLCMLSPWAGHLLTFK